MNKVVFFSFLTFHTFSHSIVTQHFLFDCVGNLESRVFPFGPNRRRASLLMIEKYVCCFYFFSFFVCFSYLGFVSCLFLLTVLSYKYKLTFILLLNKIHYVEICIVKLSRCYFFCTTLLNLLNSFISSDV